MTIWFSTNIPEMRAISTFNRVSTDISEIQQRITTGQRINSGKDDPGGLIIREGLRADIKGIHAIQANMVQAENLMDVAAGGMMQLLEILVGSDTKNPGDGGLLGALLTADTPEDAKASAENFLKLYDTAINTTTYRGERLIGGDLVGTALAPARTYQLGGGQTLGVSIANLSSSAADPGDPGGDPPVPATPAGAAAALKTAVADIADAGTLNAAIAATRALQTTVANELGTLGNSQKVVAQNQRLLDSRLTTVTAAEGRISNADIAIESSRMARAELLAQNAMSSIMYTRNYAAFAVSSLFR